MDQTSGALNAGYEVGSRARAGGSGLAASPLQRPATPVESGCDLVLLMTLGGWSSLTMVQRYSHPSDRGQQAISAMLAARALSESPSGTPRVIEGLARRS